MHDDDPIDDKDDVVGQTWENNRNRQFLSMIVSLCVALVFSKKY